MKISSLNKLPLEQNTHNPKISKKVLIRNGEVSNLTNFTKATFPPGEVAAEHVHKDMTEIFFVEKGHGQIKINGKLLPLNEGDCITVEPGDKHELINSSKKDLIFYYLGVLVS